MEPYSCFCIVLLNCITHFTQDINYKLGVSKRKLDKCEHIKQKISHVSDLFLIYLFHEA